MTDAINSHSRRMYNAQKNTRADLAIPAPAVKVKALVWEPDELGWKAKGAAKEYTVYRESQKRTADADNRERILVWIEEPNSTLSQSATPLEDPLVLEGVAAALWKAQVTDAGSPPSVIRRRTPEAFADQAEETRNKWLKYARAALSALEENK